jgi:hypothetical protein
MVDGVSGFIELLEKCSGQRLFELADQRGIKGF